MSIRRRKKMSKMRNPLQQGFPTWGTLLKSVISWVHLYQWGDATDVRGDADTKKLGTPALQH
jgi:hypothetical protein